MNYLDTYFDINEVAKGNRDLEGITIDFIVSNVEFNQVTQKNHQTFIDRFRDKDARESINSYFQSVNLVNHAKDEFNKLIERETRPFFLRDQEVFNNSLVFNQEDRTFPPFLGVSVIDTTKAKAAISNPTAIALISQLRMSIGYYLAALERSIEGNSELIAILESKLK